MTEKIILLLAILLPITSEYLPGGSFKIGRRKVKKREVEKPLTTKEYLERL